MNQQDKRGLIVASAIGVLVILLFKVFGTLTTTNANGEVEVIRMRDLLESPMSVEQAFQTGKAAKKSSHSGFAFKPLPASKNPIVAKKKPELKVADNKKKPKKDKKKTFAYPDGLEPSTYSLEGCCSIQLSYGYTKVSFVSKRLVDQPVKNVSNF